MPTAKIDREGKSGTYKEVAAIKINSKEQRCLTKNLQLLGVETKYSINLINLGSRDLRKYYSSLKERCSKLKSHLTAEEIAELKKLDEDGKLEGIYTSVTPNLHARINAEAKRLNLDMGFTSRPRTAIPVTHNQGSTEKEASPHKSSVTRYIRPHSEKPSLLHRESIKNTLNNVTENGEDNSKYRPNTAHPKLESELDQTVKPKVSLKRSTPVNYRKTPAFKKEGVSYSDKMSYDKSEEGKRTPKSSVQTRIRKSESIVEKRTAGRFSSVENVRNSSSTPQKLTRENLERQNAQLKLRKVKSMIHPSQCTSRTITAAKSTYSKVSDKTSTVTVKMPKMAFMEEVCQDENTHRNTPRRETLSSKSHEELSSARKGNSHVSKVWRITDRHTEGRTARQDFVDSITPDSLGYSSDENSKSFMSKNKNLIEVSKGKMKFATTKTFTAEEVASMNRKNSLKQDLSETDNLVLESVRSKSSACSTTRTETDVSQSASMIQNLKENSENYSQVPNKENVQSSEIQAQNLDSPRTVKHHFRKFRPSSGFDCPPDKPSDSEKRAKSSKSLRRSATVGQSPRRRGISISGSFNASTTKSRFSSHAVTDKDESIKGERPLEKGRTPNLQDALHDHLGESIHEEIRRDLLNKEHAVTAEVQAKLASFLQNLDSYIKRNKEEEEIDKTEKNVYTFSY